MAMTTLLALVMLAQGPSVAPDMMPALAAKIAAAIKPASDVRLAIAAIEPDDAVARRELIDALVAALRTAGVRIVEREVPTSLIVSCLNNLRERVCVAEILRGAARDVVSVARAHEAPAAVNPPLSFAITPMFSQRAPILDVALVADRLLVLDPRALTLYQRSEPEWRRIQSQPIASPAIWPRDVRGRLRVDGSAVEAFLPGVTCRGTTDLATLTCVEGRREWPIGLDNNGVDPRRNHFATSEGLPFFSVAPLNASSGATAMIADDGGRLALLDASRRRVADGGAGDDVAAIRVPCAAGPHVLVSTPASGRDDSLHLVRIVDRQVVPIDAGVRFTGSVTALWGDAATTATVVTYHRSSDSYEAFHIRIACDR